MNSRGRIGLGRTFEGLGARGRGVDRQVQATRIAEENPHNSVETWVGRVLCRNHLGWVPV